MSGQRFIFTFMAVAITSSFSADAIDSSAAAKATAKLTQATATAPKAQSGQPAPKLFSQAELDQMLAPVALYPDTVLSHVLIAATYPLEIVKATRWLAGKPGMTSEQSLKAAENENWDPSVRALVAFPPLLTKMNNELEWTQKLGDAFLIQEKQVMATVQRLREKAYTAGNLSNQEHIRVERKEKVIVIEPARPEVVYVPVYDTRVVYGDWWWRAYPPIHWPYPERYSRSTFYWGAGVQVTPVFYSSTFYWPRREIVVIHHHHRPTRYYRSYDIVEHVERRHWRHNPRHRHGVVYHQSYQPVRESYGDGPAQHYDDREERRRWAAERRIQNQVGSKADEQLVNDAASSTEPNRLNLPTVELPAGGERLPMEEQLFPDQILPDSAAPNAEPPTTGLVDSAVSDAPAAESALPTEPQPELPVLSQPEPVYQQPEPVFQQPEPVYQQPEPVFQQPEPVYQQPEPVFQQPEPVYQQPEPVFQQPEPVYQQPEPVFQQPEPVYQQPEPAFQQPEPVYQQPEPVYQQPEPVFQQPEPVYQPQIENIGNQP